jgi:hypothetical protein
MLGEKPNSCAFDRSSLKEATGRSRRVFGALCNPLSMVRDHSVNNSSFTFGFDRIAKTQDLRIAGECSFDCGPDAARLAAVAVFLFGSHVRSDSGKVFGCPV